jgi:hypothetical protein
LQRRCQRGFPQRGRFEAPVFGPLWSRRAGQCAV